MPLNCALLTPRHIISKNSPWNSPALFACEVKAFTLSTRGMDANTANGSSLSYSLVRAVISRTTHRLLTISSSRWCSFAACRAACPLKPCSSGTLTNTCCRITQSISSCWPPRTCTRSRSTCLTSSKMMLFPSAHHSVSMSSVSSFEAPAEKEV